MRAVADPGWHMRPPARQYSEELQREIQRLRAQVAIQEQEIESLREERREGEESQRAHLGRHRRLEAEAAFLSRQLDDVIEKNRLLSDRCARAEERCSTLAHRLAASTSLLEAGDRPAVVEAICGVLANLVGCEDMALFACNETGGELTPLRVMGRPPGPEISRPDEEEWILLEAVRERRVCMHPGGPMKGFLAPAPLAAVPLLAGDLLVGVVVLYRLLPQRSPRLGEQDLEILRLVSLLGGQAYHLALPEASESVA